VYEFSGKKVAGPMTPLRWVGTVGRGLSGRENAWGPKMVPRRPQLKASAVPSVVVVRGKRTKKDHADSPEPVNSGSSQ
jgi:hypothetical protein